MFKSQRNTFRSSRNPYYSKRRRRFSPFWLIVPSIPLILILLELLARFAIGVSGQSQELANYKGEPSMVTAYRLKFLTPDKKPYEGLSNQGELLAQRNLSVGYGLASNQQNSAWQINEQGFRDDRPLPLDKPANEIRIFILGNSTAFGQWNQGNAATIAPKLADRINERVAQQKRSPEKYRPDVLSFYRPEREKALALPPKIRDGQYRVINAAVPGYSSGNHLAQFALEILPYKPDVIVVLGGYPDLMLSSQQEATQIPDIEKFLTDAPGHYRAYLTQSLQEWVKSMASYKALQYWVLKPEPSLAQKTLGAMDRGQSLNKQLAADGAELDRRIERYRDRYKQMIQLSAGASVPMVLAIQPEITGRSPDRMSEAEKSILQELGKEYQQKIEQSYGKLAQANDKLKKAYPNNVYIVNFHTLDAKGEKTVGEAFVDPIHLTEEANVLLAKRLYDAITGIPKMQMTPKNFAL